MLIDTSVWVEYLRRTESAADLRLTGMIESADPVATTEPVWAELLSGRHDRAGQTKVDTMLAGCELLPVSGLEGFRHAAKTYSACRRGGFTPRSMFDCLIAAVAIEHDAELLHVDRDFDRIARHVPLRIAAL